jgi:hypothetical protein
MPLSIRSRFAILPVLALCFPGPSVSASPEPSTAKVLIPVGDVALDIDVPQIDEKMGGAFVLGLRSGANNCYIESLSVKPGQEGEIAFVVKPPAGEGRFLVTVSPKGTLDPELVACVRGIFDMFYHYENKTPFESVPGTLSFTPRTIAAPPLPTEAELRAALDADYAASKIVRVTNVVQKDASLDDSSNEIFKRYAYEVGLVFVTDGYESACTHYEPYKVFTRGPYKTPYDGHSCETKPHRAGDHTVDTVRLTYSLKLWPEVGAAWELHGGSMTGTLPASEP